MTTATEFQRRRQRFVELMGDGVAVFLSAPERLRTNDSQYDYRQDTDFFYLTGLDEPSSVLVLAPAHKDVRSALFVRPAHKEQEQWNGRRVGVEGAKDRFGVDAAYPISELGERLGAFLETADKLYYSFGADDKFNSDVIERLQHYRGTRARSGIGPVSVIDPSTILHEMRLTKSAFDIAGMRRAADVSAAGHVAAMRFARPGMHEYEIEAIVEYTFAVNGAQAPAYSTIVASGRNLYTIHYASNRDLVPDGSLVLVDAGAEVDYYNGDITRTWPISGKFSAEQRAIYEVVLAAQLRAIELAKPGNLFNSYVNDEAAKVLTQGLIELRLLAGSVDEHLEKQTHKRFTVHRIGHWLGMDTHDVGAYKRNGEWRPLQPGMVVTIEPGLYIPDESDVPERFRGISVRVEDDVLITADGNDVLTAKAPKKIADIEKLIAEGRTSNQALIA